MHTIKKRAFVSCPPEAAKWGLRKASMHGLLELWPECVALGWVVTRWLPEAIKSTPDCRIHGVILWNNIHILLNGGNYFRKGNISQMKEDIWQINPTDILSEKSLNYQFGVDFVFSEVNWYSAVHGAVRGRNTIDA